MEVGYGGVRLVRFRIRKLCGECLLPCYVHSEISPVSCGCIRRIEIG